MSVDGEKPNERTFPMTTIVEANHDQASPEDLKDDLDLLKKDMASLRDDMKSTFANLKGFASVQARHGVEKGKELAEDAGEHLESARADLQAQIREKPMAAVGLAFGAGLLIALIGRK